MSEIPTAQDLSMQIDQTQRISIFKLGTVTELFSNGTAKVQFDGEESASAKQYAYLSDYKPAANDRVLMAAAGGTYIVLGKLSYNTSPSTSGAEGSFSTLTTSGQATLNAAKINTSIEIDGDLNHDGSKIGFFGMTPQNRQTVTQATSDAETRACLNALLAALFLYGLIDLD